MSKITFPLKHGMQGATVADLQDALQQCLERRAVLPNDENARRQWSEMLRPERCRAEIQRCHRQAVKHFPERAEPASQRRGRRADRQGD